MHHGAIEEILPDVFFVSGSFKMPTPLPVTISRNMTVVREGGRLVLVNTVRLDEEGLAKLDALGKVTDVIRIAGNHGSDDPFYADRYGAKVWAVKGQRYTPGFDAKADAYFEPSELADASTALPLSGARLHVIGSRPPEALLLLPHHGGIIVAGDCLQNWASTDAYFNGIGRVMTHLLGFIRPHNVGPAWLKQSKPPKDDLRAILGLPFVNVLPAHGSPVLGKAVDMYRPVLERVTAS
jgi:hypothetical protein